jgi:hypothetical protein
MTRPGVEITSLAQPPPRSAPTDTGVWFAVGATAIGPANTAVLIRSMTEYEATFGTRVGGPTLYDAVECYFREGGARVYISALPTTPSALEAAAEEPPAKRGKAAAAEEPEAQAATPAQLNPLLDVFTADLGPGQVSIPGTVDPTTYQALLTHASTHNRIALLTGPATGTVASILALVTPLRSLATARYGAFFAPQAIVPGVAVGTTRQVGYAAIEAGIISRNDALGLNPNVAAAGDRGVSAFATDLTQTYIDTDYQALNDGGADMARKIYGLVETYGYRTLVDPAGPDAAWLNLGNARLNMAIVAQAEVIAEHYVFAQLDGRRRMIGQFGGDLRAMLVPFYEAGALYGDSADDAFAVNVGPQVNTEQTIANGELHAVIEARMSPFAELVVIEIVKVATTESLAA